MMTNPRRVRGRTTGELTTEDAPRASTVTRRTPCRKLGQKRRRKPGDPAGRSAADEGRGAT